MKADLVLSGGKVWAGAGSPPGLRSIAVAAGRVVGLGSDREIESMVGPGTQRVRLAGRCVLPGFVDAHTHFIDGGLQLSRVDLRSASSREEFSRLIAERAAGLPKGSWVLGGDWDHELWGGMLPTREWIDSATPDHPVMVLRLDLHMALANSAALERAGITRDTADPPGGTVVRDPEGMPTGVLKDEAMRLVWGVCPRVTPEERQAALQRATDHALSLGVTQVHDMGSWIHLETFRRARAEGSLGLRVYSLVQMKNGQDLPAYMREHGSGDERLWWGGLKAFVDGSLGSKTAWFYEGYSDEPSNHGLTVTDLEELEGWIGQADAAGLQCVVHAIGDRANGWLLDAFGAVAQRNGERDRRFRIEHAQHLTAADLPRFGAQDIIASVQPYHAADDGRWAEKRVGPDRVNMTYAFGSLMRGGARLAFGSDWTVAPLNPLLAVEAAVTRRTIDGRNPGGWIPRERVDLLRALEAHTWGSAFAGFSEGRTGSLRIGSLADLVVLSGDVFQVPAEAIGSLKVDRTVVEGETVYQREGVGD